jgi:hypothetical protein
VPVLARSYPFARRPDAARTCLTSDRPDILPLECYSSPSKIQGNPEGWHPHWHIQTYITQFVPPRTGRPVQTAARSIEEHPSPLFRPRARCPKCRDLRNLQVWIPTSGHRIQTPPPIPRPHRARSRLSIRHCQRLANTIQRHTPRESCVLNILGEILKIM